MIKLKGKALTFTLMEQDMKETGRMINSMVRVLKFGQITLNLKETFKMEKRKV
jgi:hypothetical protein